MIERRDTPAPLMQRRVPPPLDFRSKSKQTTSASSPPHTPPPFKIRARAKRASNVHADRQTPRETYLNSKKTNDGENARGDGEPQVRDERISHDLSLTDNNRYSVVDNMLMSLNPDPSSTPPDSLAFSAPSRFVSTRSSHRRGHTHSSSLNTDYTLPFDDSPLRSSGQATRSRRSNSSSNFQSGLGRIDSIHRDGERLDHMRPRTNSTQRAFAGEKVSGAPSRKSRKSSKSSGSSSVDFGHIMGQPRWQTSAVRRSSSFERNFGRESSPAPKRPVEESPIVSSFAQPVHYHVSDAAPTPTVPVGPGRSPGFPPQPVHAPPQAPPTLSWNSHKSSKPYQGRKIKGGSLRRDTEGKGNIKVSNAQEDDSVPAFVISRNLSPTRHGSATSAGFKPSPASQVKEQSKERPGFFRRVFGSSRNNPSWTTEASPAQLHSSRNSIRAESRGSFASPHKTNKLHPNEDGSSQFKENIPPALAKKPSSFFRRRKKSVSSPNNSTALPMHVKDRGLSGLEKPASDPRPGSSSISSLREVMNPYLGRAPTLRPRGDSMRDSTAAGHRGSISTSSLVRNESKVMPKSKPLSSTREPPLDGRVGHLRHNQPQDHGTRTENSPRSTAPETLPQRPGKAKADDVLLPIQNSFFNDNSSTETKTIRSSNNAELPGLDPEVPLEVSSGDGRDAKPALDPMNQPFPMLPQTPISVRKLKPLSSRSGTFPPVTPTSGNVLKHSKTADWHATLQITPTGGSISRAAPSKNLAGAWLAAEELEDDYPESDRLNLPLEGIQPSPVSEYQSASSTLITPKTLEPGGNPTLHHTHVVDTAPLSIGDVEPTEDDRLVAQRIFDGDENFMAKERAAAWLGEAEPDRARVRRAYMELFGWQNLNILASLRDFCSRLVLKGETQQVDRILDAFSWRWCVCNPNHGFKATGRFLPFTRLAHTDLKQQMLSIPSVIRYYFSTPTFTWPISNRK